MSTGRRGGELGQAGPGGVREERGRPWVRAAGGREKEGGKKEEKKKRKEKKNRKRERERKEIGRERDSRRDRGARSATRGARARVSATRGSREKQGWDSGRFGCRLRSSGYQEIRREMIQEGIELEERFRQNKD